MKTAITHLLKWQYQPELRSGSWKGSIVEHRRRIRKALKESPSLKLYLEEVFAECYSEAVEQASAELRVSLTTIALSVTFRLSVLLLSLAADEDLLPKSFRE